MNNALVSLRINYLCFMTESKENNKRNFDSFLLTVVLLFGLLIWHNSENTPVRPLHSVTSEVSVSGNDAVINYGILFPAFHKLLIFHRESFSQLSFKGNQSLENQVTDQKLSDLEEVRLKTKSISPIFYQYHFPPTGKDDLPPLS
jgi:hypothetical protein